WMLRDVQNRSSDQNERGRIPTVRGVPCEEVKKLRASFVRVDATGVDDVWSCEMKLRTRACRIDGSGNLRTDAHHDSWDAVVGCRRAYQFLFFRRVIHDRANAPEDRPEHRQSKRRVAFGCRDEYGTFGNDAGTVVRMKVAGTEEEHEVELRA